MMNSQELQLLADSYFEKNEYQKAVKLYEQCIQQNFLSYGVIAGLGNIEDQKGYYQFQLGYWYNHQKRRGSLNGSPFQALALIYSTNSYIQFAKDYFLSLLSLYPKNYQIILCLGHTNANLRNYQKAEAFYLQAISIDSSIQYGYYALASLNFYQYNDQSKARQYSMKALNCNKDNILAKIINIYTSSDYYENKICQLIKIYDKQPMISCKIKNLIGCLLFKHNQFSRAYNYFSESIGQNKRYVSAFIGISSILIETSRYDQAQQYLNSALKLDPGCKQVLNGLGLVCLLTKRYQQSIQWYYASYECNEADFEAYYGLGNCYYMQNDFISAIDWLEQALQRGRNRFEIYQSLGNCYINLENYQKSLQFYLKSFELNKSIQMFRECIKILSILQRYQDVVALIQENIKFFEQDLHIIYFILGHSFVMIDEFCQAEEAYKKSLIYSPQFEQSMQCLNKLKDLDLNN